MTMLERAAKALYEQTKNVDRDPEWEKLGAWLRGAFMNEATIVLQAIREPDDSVMISACENLDRERWLDDGYTAIIDAIINQGVKK